MHVHRIAEIADDPLRAQAARLLFVGIAPLDVEQLFVSDGHTSTTNPVFAVPGVNVIVIGQRDLEVILARISDRLRAGSAN
jgi:hypothetical protein